MFNERSSTVAPASNSITDGVHISVRSFYVPEQSTPLVQRYVFAYTVRIGNRSDKPVRLHARHWYITDATGAVEEVRGEGVRGVQPRLEARQEHEYTSGCVLRTMRGMMRGHYVMVRDDGSQFTATIAPFALVMPVSFN